MGSPVSEANHKYNETQHQVRVSNFSMSKYAVTVAEFRRFVEESGYRTNAEKDGDTKNWRYGVSEVRPQSEENHPVLYVSWNDAVAYCKWLSKKTRKHFRLPTEAEWEYACRAASRTPFNTKENLTTSQANYNGIHPYNKNSLGIYRQNTVEVNSFAPNAFDLYNMHGNVWEWTSDWYCRMYYDNCKANCKSTGIVSNPAGPKTGSRRVMRGGSWISHVQRCRSADRNSSTPHYRYNFVGFRLVFVQSSKNLDSCSQPSLLDDPMVKPLPDRSLHECDIVKQQPKQLIINGLQGEKLSFEFCGIPVDKVIIDKEFYLGKYPVTQQQWKFVMGNNPSHFKGDSLPVEKVSHNDVQAFIQKLNLLSGKQYYRLPTEAEWEYACRAGSTSAYYFGDNAKHLGEYAWYFSNSRLKTHPVGKKKPNDWGLHDMAGNVLEWTDSWYHETRSLRVFRGGCWRSSAECCRSAYRSNSTPVRRYDYVGFRLVYVP